MFKGSLLIRVQLSSKVVQSASLHLGERPGFHWEISGGEESILRRKVEDWLASYAAGKATKPKFPIDLQFQTPFTQAVLALLSEIPFGHTLTYTEVAQRLSNPRASRAVGSACGRNPCPLFVPCHRVLAAGNGLGGFSSGLEIKRLLLNHERIDLGSS